MLVDTSVLVADAVAGHPQKNSAAVTLDRPAHYSVAAHSLSEMFNTLTRPRGYVWSSQDAARAVSAIARRCEVVTLNPTQHQEGIALFAAIGGIGARLYDYLIGHHAVVYRIPAVITLNDRDFRPLFPQLTILTPAQYLETL